ncbi:chondroitin proteoglycan 2 [Drosophila miranda]|uniref:chondroitin proteoglycan 2 n=1 Tax=Drosophila miranda TaxID=7229 RepID=UPI0007E80BB8|nr:chondroitin proteoglycan 2 [Drosophila miranda]
MKLLGVLWTLCLLYKTSLARIQDGFSFKTSICDGKNGGLLPMYGTCRGYYVCLDGNAVIGSCERSTLFNPKTLHCDDAVDVDCIFEAKLNNYNDGSNSESEEDEEPQEIDSPPTRRPSKQQRPVAKQLLDTFNRVCAGKKDGVTLAKDGSCSEYIVCESKQPHLRVCPTNQHFSPTRRICMKPKDAKCLVGHENHQLEEPATSAGVCPEEKENSLVAHQKDCGKFLLCSNMMFLVMDCPIGLHFNSKTSRCDYPKIAKCQVKEKGNKAALKTKTSARKPKNRRL